MSEEGKKFSKARDWEALRFEWASTSATVTDISKKYNIPIGSLNSRFSNDNWKQYRIDYIAKVGENYNKIIEERALSDAVKISNIKDNIVTITERVSERLMEIIEKPNDPDEAALDEITVKNLQKIMLTASKLKEVIVGRVNPEKKEENALESDNRDEEEIRIEKELKLLQ